MGVELKRNLMSEWWTSMVHEREDIVGLDAAIIMHPEVWRASGHLANFSDPLVDCKVCGERFRADKAPKIQSGADVVITLGDKGKAKSAVERLQATEGIALERKGKELHGAKAGDRGYACPNCGSTFMSDERQFNLMFRSTLGAVDPVGGVIDKVVELTKAGVEGKELRTQVEAALAESAVYLRPETAQAMFVQFLNVQQSMSAKVPFGIAQMGKSFRNEVTVEQRQRRCNRFLARGVGLRFNVAPADAGDLLPLFQKQVADGQRLVEEPPRIAAQVEHKAFGSLRLQVRHSAGEFGR
jgi:glycyl-tRNA synthetase